MAQLVDERLNAQQYIPITLSASLEPHGLDLIKRECGFPNNWTFVDIGVWLGQYDYIPIARRQMPRNDPNRDNVNIPHYITTNYNTRGNFWNQVDIVWIHMPIVAFDPQLMLEIGNLIIGNQFDIQDYHHWMRYMLLGGPDRIRIGVRRYDPNIHIDQMFQNLNLDDNLDA